MPLFYYISTYIYYSCHEQILTAHIYKIRHFSGLYSTCMCNDIIFFVDVLYNISLRTEERHLFSGICCRAVNILQYNWYVPIGPITRSFSLGIIYNRCFVKKDRS